MANLTACILTFFRLIQLEFLCDTVKGLFLIGAKFWNHMMSHCSAVTESKYAKNKQDAATILTCMYKHHM